MPPKFCAKCLDEEEEVAATHHCPTCNILLCEVHLMLHNKVAKTKGHAADVVEVKEEEEEKKQIMCKMCTDDDEETVALYFCPVCKVNICELHFNLHNKMSKTKGHEKEVKILGEDGLSTCAHCQAHCSDDFIDAVYSCRECKTNLCYNHAKIHTLACSHAKNPKPQGEGCSQLASGVFRLLAENKFKQFAGDFEFVGFLGSTTETHDEFFLKGNEGKQPQQFKKPSGLKINIFTKEIFVCDTDNSRIQIYDLTSRAFKREMKFFSLHPLHLDFDLSDDTMVIVSDSQTVSKYSMDGRSLIWEYGQQGKHSSTDDTFGNPRGVVVDNEGDGNIYVAEWNNDRIKVLTRDGKFVKHFSEKQLWTAPQGLAMRNGNLLVNSRCYGQGQVAELSLPDGEFVKSYGKKQDLDPELHDSCYMCAERFSGNIVIADTGDSWTSPIKFIKGQSLIKLEKPRGCGKLQFSEPTGIDIDPYTGLLYVCDCQNNRVQILK